MSDKGLSRRQMLKGLGLAAVGAAAAACQPKTVIVEKEVEKVVTQVVEVEKEVTKIVAGTSVVEKVIEKVVETRIVEKEVPVAPAEIRHIYLWPTIAPIRPEGSHPERYDAVQQYIFEQTGIMVHGFIAPPGDAGDQRRNLLLGSRTEKLDLFSGDWGLYKDAIIPINDLLEQYGPNLLKVSNPSDWGGMKDVEGNIWGMPRLGVMGHTAFTWFRTDWLEKLGLDMPTTWEAMEETLTAFKEMNSDAVVVTNNLNGLLYCLLGGWTEYGASNWWDKAAGELKPQELQPGYQDWLAKMNEWWEKDWFHKEAFAGMDFEEAIKTGNVGMHAGWYSRITILVQRLIVENAVPGMEFGFPLSGITGPKGLIATNRCSMNAATMITRKAEHPEAVMEYINWVYGDKDNLITAFYGIKGVDWEWVDEDDQFYVRRLAKDVEGERVYAGEFAVAAPGASSACNPDATFAPDDEVLSRHYEHMRDYTCLYDSSKFPVDCDVPYDLGLIRDKVPGLEDINRLINEETIKFITGIRPASEYDAWVDQLYKAGMQDLIDARTEQYLIKFPQ